MARAWSASALTSFETCPKRYYHTSIKKDVADPPSEAQDWGTNVHAAFQKRIVKGAPLPLGMGQYEEMLAKFAALPGEKQCELKLAINADWEPCGWFGSGVWVRAVLDYVTVVGTTAVIADWKTGKRKEDDEQLAIMAFVAFCHLPLVQQVRATFVWLQEDEPETRFAASSWTRDEMGSLISPMLPRVQAFQKAFATSEYPAKPGPFCRRWCPVKQCVHHGT